MNKRNLDTIAQQVNTGPSTSQQAIAPSTNSSIQSLTNKATDFAEQGKYLDAARTWKEAIRRIEAHKPLDKELLASSLNSLAVQQHHLDDYKSAKSLLIRSLKLSKEIYGSKHANIAVILNNLGEASRDTGQPVSAEEYFHESLSILKEQKESNRGRFAAIVLLNLGETKRLQGKNREAEDYFMEALPVFAEAKPRDDLNIARVHGRLALLYNQEGQLDKAEKAIMTSIAIFERIKSTNHPDIATSLTTLSRIYQKQGQIAKAVASLRRAIEIYERTLGENHSYTGIAYTNLADTYRLSANMDIAEPLYRKALRILEKDTDANKRIISAVLNGLALIHFAKDSLDEARDEQIKANRLAEQALGDNHEWTAIGLNNLGEIHRKSGNSKDAETLFRRSLKSQEESAGKNTLTYTMIQTNLALALNALGKQQEAVDITQSALSIQHAWLSRELPLAPNQLRLSLTSQTGYTWMIPFSLLNENLSATTVGRLGPIDTSTFLSGKARIASVAAELALNTRLSRQGLLQEIERQQALIATTVPAKDISSQISAIIFQLASPGLTPKQRTSLEEERNLLQRDLYREYPSLRTESIAKADIMKRLPGDGALIEFQRYNPFDIDKKPGKGQTNSHYLALVLTARGNIQVVLLGLAAPLEAAIHQALNASQAGYSDATQLWANVSNRILAPLTPHLSGVKELFLSLDGELNRVPFAALPSPQQPDTPLGSEVRLRLLTTGRDLLRLEQPPPTGSQPVVVANPNFNRHATKPPSTTAINPAQPQRRSGDLDNKQWSQLPATEQEGNQVATLLGVSPIKGDAASTVQVLQLQAPRVLHIATHGFVLVDQSPNPNENLGFLDSNTNQLHGLRLEDPQLRSGLVLAGANQPSTDPSDDGLLTAAEALLLNLNGTELVVLSACSTGQGDIRTGEGVYGLQRSLTVAGARSTLLSLWKVDDTATADFMTRFYTRLKAGEARSDALAATQKEFRNGIAGDGQWKAPYYWAAWQLVGDWRPIQGL